MDYKESKSYPKAIESIEGFTPVKICAGNDKHEFDAELFYSLYAKDIKPELNDRFKEELEYMKTYQKGKIVSDFVYNASSYNVSDYMKDVFELRDKVDLMEFHWYVAEGAETHTHYDSYKKEATDWVIARIAQVHKQYGDITIADELSTLCYDLLASKKNNVWLRYCLIMAFDSYYREHNHNEYIEWLHSFADTDWGIVSESDFDTLCLIEAVEAAEFGLQQRTLGASDGNRIDNTFNEFNEAGKRACRSCKCASGVDDGTPICTTEERDCDNCDCGTKSCLNCNMFKKYCMNNDLNWEEEALKCKKGLGRD